MSAPQVLVIGGGLAGLMAAIRVAEKGANVKVFSLCAPKRSHSACAQGGINGAINTLGQGDSPKYHFEETIYGGDFLANQTIVKGFTDAAPRLIHMLDRMGVTFNRTPEGLIDLRRAGGTKFNRVAFAGGTTGQQMLYALDEQTRKLEEQGRVEVLFPWDFMEAIIDEEGNCRGAVLQDLTTMEVKAFRGDAVIMATGGLGYLFGKSTNAVINNGSAVSALYQQGAIYANGEFIQIHPTSIPMDDKNRLMSETCRGEGGRVWVYKDGKPWYFLEEWYPNYGNLVPRDIATREIFKVCVDMKLGIDGENMVYLDLSHLDPNWLQQRLGGILDMYEIFVGDDPRKVPMKIFPTVHFTMGGLWVDETQTTKIPGLYAAGECEYQYHGANRLGGNAMPACMYAGELAGNSAMDYIKGLAKSAADLPDKVFDSAQKKNAEVDGNIYKLTGTENPYLLHREMGEWMTNNATVVRYNDRLQNTDNKLLELMERFKKIGISDNTNWSNQVVPFTRQLWNMLELSRVITIGAIARNESRGAHYKPDFPERDDENWLKTTLATYSKDGPKLSYEDVDIQHVKPRPRRY
ncbi:MAG: succinate dehydrogenase flavoprotein subunit [Peptococcaceae bacterium]|jgi:succinate dehydrogenase / fumarate reductase flavoprotein subunit|nr:succinate dehydrogenase flavoprotein subunit [Peptococcaceae bacterium]